MLVIIRALGLEQELTRAVGTTCCLEKVCTLLQETPKLL